MGLTKALHFLENKTILLTGATGFLAKVLVEKIVRIQPNIKRLILILRATETKSAVQRFHDEVIGMDLFRVLREKWGDEFSSFISEKVLPVSGDASLENLGIKDVDLLEDLTREIDVIVNSAATTRFDDRYDVSLAINTIGAMHVLRFAKKCTNISLLLHVSTAYVAGEKEGIIAEEPFPIGKGLNGEPGLDIDAEKRHVQDVLRNLKEKEASINEIKITMRDLGLQRAKLYGWPNTYVFTKAMGEMLLCHFKENLPLVILRPTIITSTCKEPFPGWSEGLRTLDALVFAAAKGQLSRFMCHPESICDVMPGDMVVNSMIAAMVNHANKPSSEAAIYHVGSSLRNPMKLTDLPDIAYDYFDKHPCVDKSGKIIRPNRFFLSHSPTTFRLYMTIRYIPFLKIFQLVNALLFQRFRRQYSIMDRQIKLAFRLSDLYKPYVFFTGIFDDKNTERLRMIEKESVEEDDVLYFDPKSIDWEDYFINVHFPGVAKYVVKP